MQKEAIKDYAASNAVLSETSMNRILRCETAAQKKIDWALQKLE
jgi:hypothetical protein